MQFDKIFNIAIPVLFVILFAILVFYLVKALRSLIDFLNAGTNSVDRLTDETEVTLKRTNELLEKVNVLTDDVNNKMQDIDPLVKACGELGESISDLHMGAKSALHKFSVKRKAGLISSLLASMFLRRKK